MARPIYGSGGPRQLEREKAGATWSSTRSAIFRKTFGKCSPRFVTCMAFGKCLPPGGQSHEFRRKRPVTTARPSGTSKETDEAMKRGIVNECERQARDRVSRRNKVIAFPGCS